jgi:hypothetical protein
MKHSATAIITLVSFVFFSMSCYSVQPINPKLLAANDTGNVDIRKVEKTSGEIIEFSGRHPAQLEGDTIQGTGVMTRGLEVVEVSRADIRQKASSTYHGDEFYSVIMRDGKIYSVVNKIVEQNDSMLLYVLTSLSNNVEASFKIALHEARKVWAEQFDFGRLLLGLVIIPLAAFLSLLAIANLKLPLGTWVW